MRSLAALERVSLSANNNRHLRSNMIPLQKVTIYDCFKQTRVHQMSVPYLYMELFIKQ